LKITENHDFGVFQKLCSTSKFNGKNV